MDDYNLSSLTESKNEWSARLVNALTPCIIEGINSIFHEATRLCEENDENEKYLMTFQNLISRIPKWNQVLIKEETERIKTKSNCAYLEDLISCVHIIQLKTLACVRVGKEQKKIDISIPSLDDFIHKTYINKIHINVFNWEFYWNNNRGENICFFANSNTPDLDSIVYLVLKLGSKN